MLGPLRKCLALLPIVGRWRWAALVPLAVATILLEVIGAAAVFYLIRILSEPDHAITIPIVGTFVAPLARYGERRLVVAATMFVAIIYLTKNAVAALTTYLRSRCVEEATAATSAAMLQVYLRAPYAFHLRRNSAELIHDADEAVQRVFGDVVASALGIVTEGLVAFGIVAVLLVAAPRITLIVTSVLAGLAWIFLRLTRQRTLDLGIRLTGLRQSALRHLQDAVGGMKEIKVLGCEAFFSDVFAHDHAALARVRWTYATLAALPRIVVETVFVSGALLVVLVVTLGGGLGPQAVPLLGLYAYAGFRLIPSVNRIVWLLSEIRFGGSAIDRVHRELNATTHLAPIDHPVRNCPRVLGNRLDLEHVSFTYEERDRPVLADVNLTIHRGESIGIVGATGVGKSTLVDLIVGLLEPTSGRITIDGLDVRRDLASWQRQIGYVPQAPFLLDDTLRRNIALGIRDAEIDEDRLRAAARRAQLDPLIAVLPRGLETTTGERGVRLSGGERQRIAVARALYRSPSVLVFDEATSALDSRTEAELTETIASLRGEITMIVVAHRLSSVRPCDRLVLLRDGRVADIGSFAEVLARNSDLRQPVADEG